MTAFLIANMAPLMFAALVVFLLLGFPVAFALAANGILFGLIGIELGLLPAVALPGAAGADLRRHHDQRHAARDPVLHVHGADPRAIGNGRGPARHDRPAVRPDARRPRLRGDLRRRAARRDHRRRRRVGDLDGPDLAADHAALRLRPAARLRRHRGVGHAGADHPAVAGADHHGRPARPVGRRHVRGRVHPGHRAGGPVRRVRPRLHDRQAAVGAGAAAGGAHVFREPDGKSGITSLLVADGDLGRRGGLAFGTILPGGRPGARRDHRHRACWSASASRSSLR